MASIPTLSIADNPSIRQSALRVRAPHVHRAAAGGDGGQRPRGEAGVRLQAGLGGAAARGQDRHPRLPRQSPRHHIRQTHSIAEKSDNVYCFNTISSTILILRGP